MMFEMFSFGLQIEKELRLLLRGEKRIIDSSLMAASVDTKWLWPLEKSSISASSSSTSMKLVSLGRGLRPGLSFRGCNGREGRLRTSLCNCLVPKQHASFGCLKRGRGLKAGLGYGGKKRRRVLKA